MDGNLEMKPKLLLMCTTRAPDPSKTTNIHTALGTMNPHICPPQRGGHNSTKVSMPTKPSGRELEKLCPGESVEWLLGGRNGWLMRMDIMRMRASKSQGGIDAKMTMDGSSGYR